MSTLVHSTITSKQGHARPSEGGCFPWYAARDGEGVDGTEPVEAPREDTPKGDGVLGME